MTGRGLIRRRRRSQTSFRVGLFGLLGSGNIGNDVSMEAVLNYLRTAHPDAVVDVMGPGPAYLTRIYGIPAVALYWHHRRESKASGAVAVALKVLGKAIDTVRIASWVRGHDVVIVPGMGVLEASVPLRAWETPYAMFLLSASGRVSGTKVALVSVGANMISARAVRLLLNSAARLAVFRSYRDTPSRDVMARRGLDVSRDSVYPDLAYAIPSPPHDAGDPGTVGLGVMAYYGNNDDRGLRDEIHASYIGKINHFVRWLVDSDYTVKLFMGTAMTRARSRKFWLT